MMKALVVYDVLSKSLVDYQSILPTQQLTIVVNFELPRAVEDYVHRWVLYGSSLERQRDWYLRGMVHLVRAVWWKRWAGQVEVKESWSISYQWCQMWKWWNRLKVSVSLFVLFYVCQHHTNTNCFVLFCFPSIFSCSQIDVRLTNCHTIIYISCSVFLLFYPTFSSLRSAFLYVFISLSPLLSILFVASKEGKKRNSGMGNRSSQNSWSGEKEAKVLSVCSRLCPSLFFFSSPPSSPHPLVSTPRAELKKP